MALMIPDEQRATLAELFQLNDEQFDRLQSALAAASPALSLDALARDIANQTDLSMAQLSSFLLLLASLIITAEQAGDTFESLSRDVANSAAEENLGGLRPGSADIENATKRLMTLLASNALRVTSRAIDVMIQHKNVFRSARVLTDFRPVFSGSDDLNVRAGVIIHNLAITAMTDFAPGQHFFALDSRDVRELRRVLDRAMRKETRIKDSLRASNIVMIEPPEVSSNAKDD
jgi:hypothetical protein